MTTEEIAIKLQEVCDKAERNEGRIKKLEGEQGVLFKLATSVEVMGEQIKHMNGNVKSLTTKVELLEAKPGKRWDSIVDKVIWAVLGALIVFALGRMGL